MCTHLPLDVDGPSTAHHGTNFTYKQPQLAPQVLVGGVLGASDPEKKREVEPIQVDDVQDIMEEDEFVLPGMYLFVCIIDCRNYIHSTVSFRLTSNSLATHYFYLTYAHDLHTLGAVPCSYRKPAKKPLKPKKPEEEVRNASENAEEEGMKSLGMSLEMQDRRSRFSRIREGVEAMKRKRETVKKQNEEDTKVVEQKKEKKRKENEKTYLNISLAQKAKVVELNTKLNWLHAKQEGKLKRIAYCKGKKLTLEQKLKLKSLKQSSKKLKKKMFHTREEISRRKATVKRLSTLRKNCWTNPNPMGENPSFADFEIASIPVTRCWEVKDNHEERAHGSVQHSAPPPTPAVPEMDNLVRPLNENREEAPVPEKRPLTRRLAKRLNPKTLVTRLQRHLSKKSENSRPLGAHPGRLRSVTENMQEIIPYEMQHYDSDPEDVADQPACNMNQTAHTAEQTMPLSGVHGRGRSDRHFVMSPEREIEMNEGQTYTMGRQLQSGSQPEYSSFRNGMPCNTPSKNRISSCRRYEVPEVDSLLMADARTLHQGETRRSNSMNDGDCLLEKSESPKTPNLKWTTRPNESKPDSGSPIVQHPVPTVTELLTMHPTRPLTRRHQRVAQPLQRMPPVDNLLENISEFEKSSEPSTSSHKSSSVRPLTGQQQRVAQPLGRMSPVNNLLENKSEFEESSEPSASSHKSSVRPLTRQQQRVAEPLQRMSPVNNLLENKSEFEESSEPSTSIHMPMPNKSSVRPLTRQQQRVTRKMVVNKSELEESTQSTSIHMPSNRPLTGKQQRVAEPLQRRLAVYNLLENRSEMEERSGQSTASQMTDKSSVRPLTRRQQRISEPLRRMPPVNNYLLENNSELGESSAQSSSIQMPNKILVRPLTRRRQRTETTSQKIERYIAAEVDRLQLPKWEESNATSRSHREPNDRDLSAIRFERPKRPESVGQRRRDEAVRRHENTSKLLSHPENRQNGSSTLQHR